MPRIFNAFSLLAFFLYANSASAQADIAVYNTNNDQLVDAANAAHDAGVRVR